MDYAPLYVNPIDRNVDKGEEVDTVLNPVGRKKMHIPEEAKEAFGVLKVIMKEAQELQGNSIIHSSKARLELKKGAMRIEIIARETENILVMLVSQVNAHCVG